MQITRLYEGPSLDTTIRAITNDMIEPVSRQYATLKQMAEQFYEKNGTLDKFPFVAGNANKRWADQYYFNRLGKELHHLANFVPKYSGELKKFLGTLPSSFSQVAYGLPEIIEKLGRAINSKDLVRAAHHWKSELHNYEEFLEKLDVSDDEDHIPAIPKKNSTGAQYSQVEQIVNDVLKRLPPNIAGDVRNAIAKSPNKLQALQAELSKRGIKMGESLANPSGPTFPTDGGHLRLESKLLNIGEGWEREISKLVHLLEGKK